MGCPVHSPRIGHTYRYRALARCGYLPKSTGRAIPDRCTRQGQQRALRQKTASERISTKQLVSKQGQVILVHILEGNPLRLVGSVVRAGLALALLFTLVLPRPAHAPPLPLPRPFFPLPFVLPLVPSAWCLVAVGARRKKSMCQLNITHANTQLNLAITHTHAHQTMSASTTVAAATAATHTQKRPAFEGQRGSTRVNEGQRGSGILLPNDNTFN